MTPPVASKKQTLLHYLSRGVAMIHLDARRAGVVVPRQFAAEAHLRLNLSYRYGIPDLEIDDARGVQATLSFGGSPFQCHLPWDSIFGITSHASGDGQVWPEDLPTEVQHTLASEERPAPAAARARPALVPIDGSGEQERAAEPPAEPRRVKKGEPPEGPPPRHLRLVR